MSSDCPSRRRKASLNVPMVLPQWRNRRRGPHAPSGSESDRKVPCGRIGAVPGLQHKLGLTPPSKWLSVATGPTDAAWPQPAWHAGRSTWRSVGLHVERLGFSNSLLLMPTGGRTGGLPGRSGHPDQSRYTAFWYGNRWSMCER